MIWSVAVLNVMIHPFLRRADKKEAMERIIPYDSSLLAKGRLAVAVVDVDAV